MRNALFLTALALCAFAAPTLAQDTTDVAEQPVPAPVPTGDLTVVVAGSPDHTLLVGALESAALTETLRGEGPFTVFAPTNAAFEAIPADRSAMLMDPAHAAMLSGLLTYHVVPERLDAAALADRIAQGGGQATLVTVHGAPLLISTNEAGQVVLTDAAGSTAIVTATDLGASNGVVHVVDVVLMPQAVQEAPEDAMDGGTKEADGSH
jgi:uncharacterized surface protein with fasciclin (FAS1) repeats